MALSPWPSLGESRKEKMGNDGLKAIREALGLLSLGLLFFLNVILWGIILD